MKLQQELKELEKRDFLIRSAINANLDDLPDNPKIERIGGGFIIRSTDLDNVWSGFYHDFKEQAKLLKELLWENSLKGFMEKLTWIVTTPGEIFCKGEGRYRFHPELIAALKERFELK